MATTPATRSHRPEREGLALLLGIVALMWIIEVINTLDGNALNSDGLHPRDIGDLWGIFTFPFLHASFAHLIDNTIPLVFMGVIVALRGAARLAFVTLIVIVVGGLGTWLISPANETTVGASGLVFVPHTGISWQGHACGAVAGVLAAWLLAGDRPAQGRTKGATGKLPAGALAD
jgi:membrane associated rhomboid family serine protease